MPDPLVSEVVLVNNPDGSQSLIRRWLSDDRIEVDWRATSSVRERWTPIDLCGGSYTVNTQ